MDLTYIGALKRSRIFSQTPEFSELCNDF